MSYPSSKGFTLIESMTSISIITILALSSLNSFSSFKDRSEMDATSRMTQQALLRAQSLAVSRQESITLCALQNGKCAEEIKGVLHIAIKDIDDASGKRFTPLESVSLKTSKVLIHGSFGLPKIAFNPLGHTAGPGSILSCSKDNHYARVTINRIGRSYRQLADRDTTTHRTRYQRLCQKAFRRAT